MRGEQTDDSFIWDENIRDAYHEQAYSWGIARYLGPAHKLLIWVKQNTLLADGQLRDYGGDICKQSWFFQGAHRLGGGAGQ